MALRLPGLDAPLLEGAAGKQTHTAMVARNLYRGRGTWLRPMVDDVGPPGYFVKELPLVPLLAATLYPLTRGPSDAVGRGIGVLAWLLAAPLVVSLVARGRSRVEALIAGGWFLLAPLGIAYSRAFMSDSLMVAVSLAALAATFAWRDRPGPGRATQVGAWIAAALLLKPHAFFWLAPAFAVAACSRSGASHRDTRRPSPRAFISLGLAVLSAGLAAGAWYAHAAAIHRAFPVLGATVAQGWVDPDLWLDPELYSRIGKQILHMVFTPAGAVLAAIGLRRPRPPYALAERALIAWGAGVVLQSIVLGTRMFDDAARGTEYYQLALVPLAGLLIARGISRCTRIAESRSPAARRLVIGAIGVLLVISVVHEVRPAIAPPARYVDLLAACREVQLHTPADADVLVVADRGGTILYYCDRRGTTLTTATSMIRASAGKRGALDQDALTRSIGRATHVFLPFPEMAPPGLRTSISEGWDRVPIDAPGSELYARRGGAVPGVGIGGAR